MEGHPDTLSLHFVPLYTLLCLVSRQTGVVLSSVPWQDTDTLSPVFIHYQASHTERQLAGPQIQSQIPGEESLEPSIAGGGAG